MIIINDDKSLVKLFLFRDNILHECQSSAWVTKTVNDTSKLVSFTFISRDMYT